MTEEQDDGGPVFRRRDGTRIDYLINQEGDDPYTWITVASEADRRIILQQHPEADVRVDKNFPQQEPVNPPSPEVTPAALSAVDEAKAAVSNAKIIGYTDESPPRPIPDQTEINRADRLLRQEISDDFSYFQDVFSRSASVTPETLNNADKIRFERLLRNIGATEYSGEPLQADGVYTDGTRMAISSIEAALPDELPHAGIRIGGGLSNAEARALFAVDSIEPEHGLDRFQRIAGTALMPPDF
jgi:hypothetical protein